MFPTLRWQPSDPEPGARRSISAWRDSADLANLEPPIHIDAAAPIWPVDSADAILCINMTHISPWAATIGVVSGAARILSRGGPLYFYGPFAQADVPMAPSNREFDLNLKARNPDWGLRSVEDIVGLASEAGLDLEQIVRMPANNLSLVFRKS